MKKIKKIIIVGGGTAAWFTAAYFSYKMPHVSISIIDKEDGKPIGVGEATILNFVYFMQHCGFNLEDWFPNTDATIKTGILFPGWKRKDNVVWHPFFKYSTETVIGGILQNHDAWSVLQDKYDFKKCALDHYTASVEHNKYDPGGAYAYHIDASKIVEYIKNKIGYRINQVYGDIYRIKRDKSGNITHIQPKNCAWVTADLFIDCTGMKSVLNDSETTSLYGRLFCDTAIAGHIPYADKRTEQRPYVISEAIDCGWVWNIPVRTRIGSGLVFNRSITDPEVAKDRFCEYWGGRADRDRLKVIDWTPYIRNKMWNKNVVSIGLSSGFIEPLESSSIGLIIEGIVQLHERIKDYTYTEDDSRIFNDVMHQFFNECVDFVGMHYADTERDEPFWQYVKQNFRPSEKMLSYIDRLADPDMPMPLHEKNNNFFNGISWGTWLIQLGYPVVPRKVTGASLIDLEVFYEDFYKKREKYRHVWCRHHAEEIERLEDYHGL